MESVASYKARGNVMRIGILTFHSEINYGSVLQAYAMQKVLEGLGHETLVIDKWEDPDNHRLLGPLVHKNPLFWLKFAFRSLMFCGDWHLLIRHLKTIRFIRKYLKRTKYHFYSWKDAPKDLGVDLITIGSDQVWNPMIVPPSDYLMIYNPWHVPAIAYSASIGQRSLDKEWLDAYRHGFEQLSAIGVREKEAKDIIEAEGFEAQHVVDPTLLVEPSLAWEKFRCPVEGRKKLVCYFLSEDFDAMLPILNQFAQENDVEVRFFFDYPPLYMLPKSLRGLSKWRKDIRKWHTGNVIGMESGSVVDFLNEISSATWVVSNSFHALMFSIVYRKNIRIVRPSSPVRQNMSARMEEFSKGLIRGRLLVNSLEEAINSFAHNETVEFDYVQITRRREESLQWLKSIIAKVPVRPLSGNERQE